VVERQQGQAGGGEEYLVLREGALDEVRG
jgi:hypothetical protein